MPTTSSTFRRVLPSDCWSPPFPIVSRPASSEVDPPLLPDPADLLRLLVQRLAGLAGEGLIELWHVHDDAVDAGFVRRVGIDAGAQAQGLGAVAAAIPLGEADEEALLGRETIHRLKLLALRLLLPGEIR